MYVCMYNQIGQLPVLALRDIYDGTSKSRCPLCYEMDVFELRIEMKLRCVIFTVFWRHLCSNEKYLENSGLNGTRTPDPCDAGAVLHQLSFKANCELVIMWVDHKPVDDGYSSLYNNPSYSLILIGSRLWSIREQTHDRSSSILVFLNFEFEPITTLC